MFGQYLLDKNIITEAALNEALETQEFLREKLGRVLMAQGVLNLEKLNNALVDFLKVENAQALIDIYKNQGDLLKVLLKNDVLVFLDTKNKYLFLEKFSDEFLKEIEKKYDFKKVFIITVDQKKYLSGLFEENRNESLKEKPKIYGPFDRFLSSVFSEAKKLKASDIHFDVEDHGLSVRLRVHGDLVEFKKVEKSHVQSLMTKLRGEVGLPLSVVGRPASGSKNIEEFNIKVRAEYSPETLGETIVCRIIDNEKIKSANLDSIYADSIFTDFLKKSLKRKNGLILLCGQTGSGKSLTLFSALMSLDRMKKKIITIEDPVEYEGLGLTQIDVNKHKLTFSEALRSSLRLDPDVIMVGEIRDEETAQLAMRASSTGHLVLSTLHTNSAIGAISRLNGMGIKEDVLLENVLQISALTLKKELCEKCKKPITEWRDEELKQEFLCLEANGTEFFEENPEGCENCIHGVIGRRLLTETIDSDVVYSKIFSQNNGGYRTLLDCGKEYASHGIISPYEVVGL